MPATNIYYYSYDISEGPVHLMPETGGRYSVIFQGENLGSYHSAIAAADDAAGGHTYTPSSSIDLGDLDIPYDLNDWERKLFVGWGGVRPG